MAQNTQIYLEAFKNKDPKDIKEIIDSLYDNEYLSALCTYTERSCKNIQCVQGRGRSFDDIYYLCKCYFPKVTPKEVIHELVIFSKKDKVFGFSDCENIRKIKIFGYNLQELRNFWINIYDKQISFKQYDSEWNWKELFALLNINSDDDLTNYRKKYVIK